MGEGVARWPIRAIALGLLAAVLALPSAAHANVAISSFTVTPSTKHAGGHPDLTLAFSFTSSSPQSGSIKDLRVVLAPGLLGDPTATPRCTQAQFAADACPGSSKVGATTVTATLFPPPGIVGVPLTPDPTGDVYNLDPVGLDAGRLGVVVRPSVGPKIFLQSAVVVRADKGYGLETSFQNIPHDANGVPVRIDSQTLTLFGSVGGKPFVRNPTSCLEATTEATATGYLGGPSTRSASFTPENCDALPYSPTVTGSIGATGATLPGDHPSLQTVISFPPDQAGTKRTELILPRDLTPSPSAIANACSLAAL